VSDETAAGPTDVPSAPTWVLGVVLLLAGAIVLGIGRAVGPHSRSPLFWGLLLCCLSLPPLRAAWVTFEEAEAATIGGSAPERSRLPGLVIVLLPVTLSAAFLATDPTPPSSSIYTVAVAITGWVAASVLWGTWRMRRQPLGSTEPPPRAPGGVRLFWPMLPGFALLWVSLPAPGSSSRPCDDGATCFDGPIALSIPALLVLIGGVIMGVVAAKGSGVDRTMRIKLPSFVPKGLDARINRLAELGRLRTTGILDDAEFERMKAEVLDPRDET
jgi:hypothetical protein